MVPVAALLVEKRDVVEVVTSADCGYQARVPDTISGIGIGIQAVVEPFRRMEPPNDRILPVKKKVIKEKELLH